jgi:hypothetical protein
MRRNEETLLAGFYIVLIGIGLFVFYYFNTMPGGPENPVKVKIVATLATQDGPGSVFLPQNFTVTEGQHVSLLFVNQDDSPHEFAIPALNVITGIVNGGQTAKVDFVPDKVGTFAFGQPSGMCTLVNQGAVCNGLAMMGNVTVLAP